MTSQQQQMRLAEELVAAARRKRALASNPYELANDRPIGTNFGNKFNRSAPYIRVGALDAPRGVDSYSQTIEFRGYQRKVISRNPLLFDEYGDLVEEESSDEEGDKPEGETVEDNPYAKINIGELLRPLTSAAELPIHPSLSRPYQDTGLLEMIRNAEKTLHQEQKKLLALKAQFVRFRGDLNWVPVGDMHNEYDDWLLDSVYDGTQLANAENNGQEISSEEQPAALTWENDSNSKGHQENVDSSLEKEQTAVAGESDGPQDVEMAEEANSNNTNDQAETTEVEQQPAEQSQVENSIENDDLTSQTLTEPKTNGHPPEITEGPTTNSDAMAIDSIIPSEMIIQVPSETTAPAPQSLTTRSQAPPSDSPTQIHPFFVHPPPLPVPQPSPSDADGDPLFMLNAYISKQAEIVRLWDTLLHGLLKSQRLRREVWRWCKAEGHTGEMSDGEDWVDLEEWGLHPEELKKGKDEEEGEPETRRGRRGRGAGDR